MDGSAGREHEVSKNLGQESQFEGMMGFFFLVVLAASGPEETLPWLLSQLLRYSFVESVEMNWKDWPGSSRTKSLLLG